MFEATFFSANRLNLRRAFDRNSLFVFTANGAVQRNGTTPYPFRQDSNFWYLSGIEEPDILLVMDSEGEYLILPERSEAFEKFNGKIDSKKIALISGVSEVHGYYEGIKKLKNELLKRKKVVSCTPSDDYISAAGIYANPSRRRLANILSGIYPKVHLIDARPQLSKQRMIKQPIEINAIEKSVSVSVSAFEKIKRNIGIYKTERDISDAIGIEFIKSGATGHAYEPVVAFGQNACVLHYSPQNQPLKKNGLVLIDAGAEMLNYAADLTRAYALSKPSDRQTEVFEAVMQIRNYALELVKPGVELKEYELTVKKYAHEVIKGLKLKNPDPVAHYPHSTSHFLGLDVHDAGDYEALISENMVLTVEPGIYIKEEGIGIRIEDDILITGTGNRNLSEQLARELI